MRTQFRQTLFAGIALLIIAVLATPLYRNASRPRGPQTREEVVAAAAEWLGLYVMPDGQTGGRIILSERPLTPACVATLWLHNSSHARWIGTVAVYAGWRGMMHDYNPACSAVWGDFFVYGDPELITRLASDVPPRTAPSASRPVRGR